MLFKKKNYRRKSITEIIKIIAIAILIIVALTSVSIAVKLLLKQNEKEAIEIEVEEVILSKDETANIEEEQNLSQGKLPILTQTGIDNINNIYNNGEKIAYLTFDDGPSQIVTPLILDKLKENDIKATFFVLGSRVGLNPDIVKRAYDEGHYIANHGYSHVYSTIYQSPEYVVEEYYQCEHEIRAAIGNENYNSHLFRFPGGSSGGRYAGLKQTAVAYLLDNSAVYIDWNCLTDDSAGAKTKESLMERLINTSQDKNNLVILMHDAGDKILTYEMLQEAIDYLRGQGYIFKNFYDVLV